MDISHMQIRYPIICLAGFQTNQTKTILASHCPLTDWPYSSANNMWNEFLGQTKSRSLLLKSSDITDANTYIT